MKVYQELESLFKFRISSNEDILPYLVRMSKLGKLDEPKKVGLFMIVLDRLGRLEDEQSAIQNMVEQEVKKQIKIPTRADEGAGVNQELSISDEPNTPPKSETDNQTDAQLVSGSLSIDPIFSCETCGKTFSSKLALAGHGRSHKPKK